MVKRYRWNHDQRDHVDTHGYGCSAIEIVGADDYDALAAENAALRQAIDHITHLAHFGGLRDLTDSNVVSFTRQLTLPWHIGFGSTELMEQKLDAAIDAAMGEKP